MLALFKLYNIHVAHEAGTNPQHHHCWFVRRCYDYPIVPVASREQIVAFLSKG
jgi:hypothetical protein